MTEVWDSLYDAFASIPDPRVERTRHHSLIDIHLDCHLCRDLWRRWLGCSRNLR